MSILRGNIPLKAYKGEYMPVNIYKGESKLAGWHSASAIGTSVEFDKTYNDVADVVISGNTVQSSDYYSKDGLLTQAGTPTPDAPIPVVSNLVAGTYKYASTDGVYEFTLADDLRGINGVVDKVVFDRVSHRGYLERRIGKYIVTGYEDWIESTWKTTNTYKAYIITPPTTISAPILCSHFKYGAYSITSELEEISNETINGMVYLRLAISNNKLTTVDIVGLKAWLIAQFNGGTTMTVYYQLATPTRTPLTFTKVSSSTKTEVPMTFITSTPSLNYPADVWSVEGLNLTSHNADSSKLTTTSLPTLRKIGSVADSYVPAAGVYTKRISDWITLDGSKAYYNVDLNAQRHTIGFGLPSNTIVGNTCSIYKHDTTKLSLGWGVDTYNNTINSVLLNIGFDLSGFPLNVYPSQAEIKAYFYGWKMCNADGTSPYYKSEVPYTPSTWAEWSKSNTNTGGVVFDSTGVEFTLSDTGENVNITKTCNFKPSTNYGILLNVISNNSTLGNIVLETYLTGLTDVIVPFGFVGNRKVTIVTSSTISNNVIAIKRFGSIDGGKKIKFKDIRIFELPTGSQIETDFNTMTADQLVAKYTFNGLCTKNWKKITDGTGQTSVLPTASYTGYTPYKMLYQLATPVVSNLAPTPLSTFYPYTKIETDGIVVKPDINATVKVMD